MRTDFQHSQIGDVPVVEAILEYKGEMLTSTPLRFIIDTGAGHTIITPRLENNLKLNASEIDWNEEFVSRAWLVQTLLGPAMFKRLKKPATLWFLTSDGNHRWPAHLKFVLFSEKSLLAGTRFFVLPGRDLEFGILGQDVLTQCGFFVADRKGLLTPDSARATHTIIHF